jgi:hypothetical protein
MTSRISGHFGRRPNAVERYLQGQELSDADLDFILRNGPSGFWETFAVEELPPAQQVYAASVAPDEAIDYFLDGEGICEDAQRVLADRNTPGTRVRLASRDDLSDDLHKVFVLDEDEDVRRAMAGRADLTDSELVDLMSDADSSVASVAAVTQLRRSMDAVQGPEL